MEVEDVKDDWDASSSEEEEEEVSKEESSKKSGETKEDSEEEEDDEDESSGKKFNSIWGLSIALQYNPLNGSVFRYEQKLNQQAGLSGAAVFRASPLPPLPISRPPDS